MKSKIILILTFFVSIFQAQTTLTGTVSDSKGTTIPGIRIEVIGLVDGIKYTGFAGDFSIKIPNLTSVRIQATGYGYQPYETTITDFSKAITIVMNEEKTDLTEIVISASRNAERLIESPVTIERVDAKEIKNTSSSNFYNGLENQKEIHLNSGSFVHKSINTRGFATASNSRFMQLVDGMENTAPSLNVAIGNLLGFSQLDVESIEILPGASSALYGANAFNGILFMNSRSPYEKSRIGAYYTHGLTSQKVSGSNTFFDFGLSGNYKFSEKFAIKGNITYLKGTDWLADDDTNIALIGKNLNRAQFYDGLNLYGDEIFVNLADIDPTTLDPGLVSRTPYAEKDLNDGEVKNFKIDALASWRPLGNDKFEVIMQHKMGTGSSNYAATDSRTYLKNFLVRQSKLELKGRNFFWRTYLTGNDAGDSYSMSRTAWNINEQWSSNPNWFNTFSLAYNDPANTANIGSPERYLFARNVSDANRLVPGTKAFEDTFNRVISDSGPNGAKIEDRSYFLHNEGNYNFKNVIKFAEIQVGGSYRKYGLDSKGTVFADKIDKIDFDEYGVYSQIQKKLLNERLKLTGSIRYDKNKNFEGNFSPRISLSYGFGKNLQRNLRASFQTGFRNPNTTESYYGLNVGPISFVGGAKDNLNRFTETITLFPNLSGQTGNVTLSGNDAYGPTYSLRSVQDYVERVLVTGFGEALNLAFLLKSSTNKTVEPERVKSYEIGYRADIAKIIFDLNIYYNQYENFIYSKKVVKPLLGNFNGTSDQNAINSILSRNTKNFQIYTNSPVDVTSIGIGFGAERKFGKFEVNFNYNYADFQFDEKIDPDFQPGFNTPKHRAKFGFGSEKLFNNFGFMTNVRWSDAYFWQSPFANGGIPAVTVFDLQVSYTLPKYKTTFKAGANNLFGNDYLSVIGAGRIGQQLFVSLIFNQ